MDDAIPTFTAPERPLLGPGPAQAALSGPSAGAGADAVFLAFPGAGG